MSRWLDLAAGHAAGGLLSPPVFADALVYVNSGRTYAFPARCAERGEDACPPAWLADKESLLPSSAPTVYGSLVFVADARPYAYPAACDGGGGACSPLWVGPPAGPLDDAAARYTAPAAPTPASSWRPTAAASSPSRWTAADPRRPLPGTHPVDAAGYTPA